MEKKVVSIINEMSEFLRIGQLRVLQKTMLKHLCESGHTREQTPNEDYLQLFLDSKRIEGCSDRTLSYYRSTIVHFMTCISEPVRMVNTEIIRSYLADYRSRNNCTNVTVDNVRRNISSFFSWLEEEDYILKSPMRRIHKIKKKKMLRR